MNAQTHTETGEPIVSAPIFVRGKVIEGGGHRSPLARSRRYLRHGEYPFRSGDPGAHRSAAAAQRADIGDHRLSGRDRPAADGARQRFRSGMLRAHGVNPHPAACRGGERQQACRVLSRQAHPSGGTGRELPRSARAGWLGAQTGFHRSQELYPRLCPAPDPCAAGQFTGRGDQVDCPGRAGQGGEPVQDVLRRSVLYRRDPADHGRNRS